MYREYGIDPAKSDKGEKVTNLVGYCCDSRIYAKLQEIELKVRNGDKND